MTEHAFSYTSKQDEHVDGSQNKHKQNANDNGSHDEQEHKPKRDAGHLQNSPEHKCGKGVGGKHGTSKTQPDAQPVPQFPAASGSAQTPPDLGGVEMLKHFQQMLNEQTKIINGGFENRIKQVKQQFHAEIAEERNIRDSHIQNLKTDIQKVDQKIEHEMKQLRIDLAKERNMQGTNLKGPGHNPKKELQVIAYSIPKLGWHHWSMISRMNVASFT